jgi:hypothetical protein
VASAPFAAGVLSAVALVQLAAGEQGMAAIAAVIKDPSTLLAARSPGGRSPGAKLDTKATHRAASTPGTQPVLAASPVVPAAFAAQPVQNPPPSPFSEAMPEQPSALSAVAPSPPAPEEGGFAGGPGGFAPTVFLPLGAVPGEPEVPSGADNPDNPPNPDTPPPVTAIPEPGSWVLLIAGLFASGLLLRRHGRAVAADRKA